MFFCEICNKKADIHHIIHRSEGGLDIEINYKYLCPEHHRGKDGPHRSLETDIKYKIELQNKLYNLLPKEFYNYKDLGKILQVSVNSLKKITKDIKLYKEGYKKDDIILRLMGNKLYSEETLENLKIQRILENIY
ncbi:MULTISPECIES: HNH endonuclease signature motif containing protein [Clostridium]|uniref:HNH endonuclease n=1 Tax=Clostridium cibarium TaxID=2762247 RepID=A0ABR8PUT2_9CLOT|nr:MULTISPECIES: HNH endonuclease signature motif containing protein [Clostridium]MBD7911931.1 HNH endonuclease [Clostridium cibarium]